MKVETEIDTTIDIMDTLGVILRLRDNNIKVYEIINEKKYWFQHFYWMKTVKYNVKKKMD